MILLEPNASTNCCAVDTLTVSGPEEIMVEEVDVVEAVVSFDVIAGVETMAGFDAVIGVDVTTADGSADATSEELDSNEVDPSEIFPKAKPLDAPSFSARLALQEAAPTIRPKHSKTAKIRFMMGQILSSFI